MSVATDMFSRLPTFNSGLAKGARNFVFGFDIDDLDPVLTIAFISLLTIGLIMVASSSISIADRNFSNQQQYANRTVHWSPSPENSAYPEKTV